MEFERQTVWEEEPVASARLPDPVRAAAVRAVLTVAVALVAAVIEVLLVAGGSWLTAPMMPVTVLVCVAATWAVLDVWVTRQVWNQRDGLVSGPSGAVPAAAAQGQAEGAAGGQPGGPHVPRPHGV